jgi:hypothetical protein
MFMQRREVNLSLFYNFFLLLVHIHKRSDNFFDFPDEKFIVKIGLKVQVVSYRYEKRKNIYSSKISLSLTLISVCTT